LSQSQDDVKLTTGLENRNVTLKQREDENKLSFKKKVINNDDMTNDGTTITGHHLSSAYDHYAADGESQIRRPTLMPVIQSRGIQSSESEFAVRDNYNTHN
jgi:hypothetical protein